MKQYEKELREEAERQKQVKIFMTEIISFLGFWMSKQHLLHVAMSLASSPGLHQPKSQLWIKSRSEISSATLLTSPQASPDYEIRESIRYTIL